MSPQKTNKKFSRAKNINLEKAEEFINGAENQNETKDNDEQTTIKTNVVSDEKPAIESSHLKNANSTIIEEKNKSAAKGLKSEKFPWETANEKILKGVNLRLTEVQWSKLRFIADNSQYSIQKYIMAILEPAMEKSIQKIIKAPEII